MENLNSQEIEEIINKLKTKNDLFLVNKTREEIMVISEDLKILMLNHYLELYIKRLKSEIVLKNEVKVNEFIA